jgi:hypothetical protein
VIRLPRALHVDDWRHAGDDNRLSQLADVIVALTDAGEAARQLDTIALLLGEPGERERAPCTRRQADS